MDWFGRDEVEVLVAVVAAVATGGGSFLLVGDPGVALAYVTVYGPVGWLVARGYRRGIGDFSVRDAPGALVTGILVLQTGLTLVVDVTDLVGTEKLALVGLVAGVWWGGAQTGFLLARGGGDDPDQGSAARSGDEDGDGSASIAPDGS